MLLIWQRLNANKIVITSELGSFEFGNTGMSSPGKGSKNYATPIIKFNYKNISQKK